MALQQFRVPAGMNRRSRARCAALEQASIEAIAKLLPSAHYSTIAELGSGTCSLAPHFFPRQTPAQFRAFESDRALLESILPPAGANHDQFSVSHFDPAFGLPLPDSSQELLLTSHYLEYLRMDEVYMTAHEARRTVKKGGLWALASLTLPENFFFGLWQKWRHPGQALDLIHYISPEDWRTRAEKKFRLGGLAGQIVILERL